MKKLRLIVSRLPLLVLLLSLMVLSGCSNDEPPATPTVAASAPAPAPAAAPQPTVDEPSAEQLFNYHCLHCHADGPGVAGTMRLRERLGADKSVLLKRDDLDLAYVKTVIRQGLFMMAPFRNSEINDEQLQALAEFVVAQGKGAG